MFCNFSNVINVLYEHIDKSYDVFYPNNPASQTAFITALFAEYADKKDIEFDSATVNRIFHNTRSLTKMIQKYYSKKFNSLFEDVCDYIIPWIVDVPEIAETLRNMVVDDTYMKNDKKLELLSCYEKTDYFIAKVIYHSMYQPLKPKEKKQAVVTYDKLYFDNICKFRKPPEPCEFFCGRDAELSELHDALGTYKHVFVRGIAGIGKSEFAKAYVEKYSSEYENIIYLTFKNDLETTIALLEITGKDKSVAFAEHYRKLESLGDNSLIIIDNFNTTLVNEPFLKKLFKLNCRILLTTRCKFEKHFVYELNEISDVKILLNLAEKIFPDAPKYADIVAEIIGILHHHTFTVTLAFQLLKTGLLLPHAVLKKLRENAVNPYFSDNLTTEKDNIYQKNDYYTHIHLLFSLFDLSEKMHYILRCCCFLDVDGIDVRRYAEWLGLDNLNDVHELDEMGLLKLSKENILSIHPIIHDIVFNDLSPNIDNCQIFLRNTFEIVKKHGIAVEDKQLADTLLSICKQIPYSNTFDYLFYIEEFYGYLEQCDMFDYMKIVSEIYTNAVNNLPEKEDRYLAKMYWIQSGYIGKARNKYAEAIPLAKKALDLADSVSLEFKANMRHNLGWLYGLNKQLNESKAELEKALDIYALLPEPTHDTALTFKLLEQVDFVLNFKNRK